MNNIFFIVLSVIIIIYTIHLVRKQHLNIKTSFFWILASIIMLILSIFPYSIDWLAKLIGIEYPPALFLTLCVVLLLIIDFNFSNKIAKLQERVTDLAQEISVLKSKDGGKK